jgi:hypothetical protein
MQALRASTSRASGRVDHCADECGSLAHFRHRFRIESRARGCRLNQVVLARPRHPGPAHFQHELGGPTLQVKSHSEA